MSTVEGTYDDRFEPLVDTFAEQLDSGEELGASIAVVQDGEQVVDVWGGWADEDHTRPWERDTIVNVWSTTKTMTNLAALVLVDRGMLDVHERVATYWPEFAAAGKQDIEVRHLLGHTSGLSAWAQPVVPEDLYDWDKAISMLAAQEPWWEPGTASGYHLLDQGHLVGEVLRRVSGRTVKQLVAEELAGPLGADFQIGATESDTGRISDVVAPPPLPFDFESLDPDSVLVKSLTGPAVDASVANTPAWRAADIGAANGHGNARSVARIQSVVSHGGEIDGVRLLSPDTIDLIFEEQANGVDLALATPLRFGIGYGLPGTEAVPYIPTDRICFWGGWGGSLVVNDLDRRTTTAYMMNKMAPGIIGSPRSDAYLTALYQRCL